MCDVHQFLKLLLGGIRRLVQLVLDGLDGVIQRRDAFLQFLQGAVQILCPFIL